MFFFCTRLRSFLPSASRGATTTAARLVSFLPLRNRGVGRCGRPSPEMPAAA